LANFGYFSVVGNQSNLRVVGTKNRKIAKNFYSLSTNELRESSIENRGLFSAQMRKFALIMEGVFFSNRPEKSES